MEPLTCLVVRPWLITIQVGCSEKAVCDLMVHCRLGLGLRGEAHMQQAQALRGVPATLEGRMQARHD